MDLLAIENILAVYGALVALAGTLAAILPKDWAFTQFLARFGTDVKGVRPRAAKSDGGASTTLISGVFLAVFLASGCGPGPDPSVSGEYDGNCGVVAHAIVDELESAIERGDDAGEVVNSLLETHGIGIVLCALEAYDGPYRDVAADIVQRAE